MKMLRAGYGFIALLAVGVLLGPCSPSDEKGGITADQARDTADQVLESKQLSGPEATFVQQYGTPKNYCLAYASQYPTSDSVAYVNKVKKILSGHRYYLVMYEPAKGTVFGFAVCVFIDYTSGDVLSWGRY